MNKEIYNFEDIHEIEDDPDFNLIKLDTLTKKEKEIINPLVPPTSGLRMEIFHIEEEKGIKKYIMTRKKTYHFLRVLKAFAVITKKDLENNNPTILIVTDDRPSADKLLDYASRIFYFENYKIYHQTGEGVEINQSSYVRGKSKMSTPYAAASVLILQEIDVVLMITASHNSLEWNGIKYYIERPIPLSGDIMRNMSSLALNLEEIKLSKKYKSELIDADKANNEYILKLVRHIIDLDVLNEKKIILWPLLGVAPEIISLLEACGIKVILIEEDLDPPNPNEGFDENKVKLLMEENNVKIAIILDADRDRLVFLIKLGGVIYNLTPNELYTAMHNILSRELGKKIINIRTIPSDPRCDESSVINFITGVGYKHLGLIQYLPAGEKLPKSQFEMAILYYLKDNEYIKINNEEELNSVFITSEIGSKIQQDLIFVMWEESGGHTFNILNTVIENGRFSLNSKLPLIGDKYPAPAILVLCALIESGYNLMDFIDQSLKAERKYIKATDEEKIKYMQFLSKRSGKKIKISDKFSYTIGNFSDMLNNIKTIHLKSKTTDLYIRPSGTGPNIKIYIYGPQETYLEEINDVGDYMNNIKL